MDLTVFQASQNGYLPTKSAQEREQTADWSIIWCKFIRITEKWISYYSCCCDYCCIVDENCLERSWSFKINSYRFWDDKSHNRTKFWNFSELRERLFANSTWVFFLLQHSLLSMQNLFVRFRNYVWLSFHYTTYSDPLCHIDDLIDKLTKFW
jgi:hypothetical protein